MDPVFVAAAILILLFSVILHEVMHGVAALRFGDHTAERAGRLTLNPIPHIDLIGTILLPAVLLATNSPFLFGWAKPVPVNPLNFRDLKLGEIVVSLSGVGANLFLAILGAVALHIMLAFSDNLFVFQILNYLVNINLVLAVFNLLPIPPLDGSRVAMALLPARHAMSLARLETYGLLILLILLMVPIGGVSLIGAYIGITVGFLRTILGL